jgi:hypothetical protein
VVSNPQTKHRIFKCINKRALSHGNEDFWQLEDGGDNVGTDGFDQNELFDAVDHDELLLMRPETSDAFELKADGTYSHRPCEVHRVFLHQCCLGTVRMKTVQPSW